MKALAIYFSFALLFTAMKFRVDEEIQGNSKGIPDTVTDRKYYTVSSSIHFIEVDCNPINNWIKVADIDNLTTTIIDTIVKSFEV